MSLEFSITVYSTEIYTMWLDKFYFFKHFKCRPPYISKVCERLISFNIGYISSYQDINVKLLLFLVTHSV